MAASDEQNTMLVRLKAQQESMSQDLREMARLNGESLDRVRSQAGSIAASAGSTAALVEKNTRTLEENYASFVDKVGRELSAQVDAFGKNVAGVMAALNENLARMKAEADTGAGEGLLARAAEMQMALSDIRRSVETLAAKADGGKEE